MVAETAWVDAIVGETVLVADEVKQIELIPGDGPRSYAPGSHLRVEVSVASGVQARSYSLIGKVSSHNAYRIAVRQQPGSRGGSQYMWSLVPGAKIRIGHPRNFFDLASGAAEYLFIAGGIGITPLLSMIETVESRKAPYRLLYLGRRAAGMPYVEQLHQLCGDKLRTFCSSKGERADLTREICGLSEGAQVYVCGPLPLMNDVRAIWSATGRPAIDLRFETFGSSGERPAEPFSVYLADRGVTVHVSSSQTILEVVRAAGVPALADCLRGECGVCTVNVLQVHGELDHRDIFLSAEQKSLQRSLCICVSRVNSHGLKDQTPSVSIDTGYRTSFEPRAEQKENALAG